MNERIEELIVAYLHRGSTPEQERELFEACRDNADVAQLLRRHLTLSLKLRRLRDETEVPPALHASLVGRINEIEHARTVAPVAPIIAKVSGGVQRLVFGWRHLVGTAVAGAALATMAFLLIPGRIVEPGATAQVVTVTDTLREMRIDTLVTTRTIYRSIMRASDPVARRSEVLPVQPAPVPVLQDDAPARTEEFAEVAPVRPARSGDASRRGTADEAPEQTGLSYIEQYTTMVSSLEQIHLTSQDRVR